MRLAHMTVFSTLACTMTTPAYAYLDPGTGSMILQGLIGAIGIGAAYLSIFGQRVKSFFSFSSKPGNEAPASGKDKSEH